MNNIKNVDGIKWDNEKLLGSYNAAANTVMDVKLVELYGSKYIQVDSRGPGKPSKPYALPLDVWIALNKLCEKINAEVAELSNAMEKKVAEVEVSEARRLMVSLVSFSEGGNPASLQAGKVYIILENYILSSGTFKKKNGVHLSLSAWNSINRIIGEGGHENEGSIQKQ